MRRGSEIGRWRTGPLVRVGARLLAGSLALLGCNDLVGFGNFERAGTLTRGDGGGGGELDPGSEDPGPATDGGPGSANDASAVRVCDPAKPFGAPVAVPGVNSGAQEVSPTLTADELTVIFQRTPGNAGGTLFQATRPNRDAPFANVTELTALVSGLSLNQQPSLSRDGLRIFFVGAQGTGGADIYVASRTATSGPFGNRRRFDEVNGSASEIFPSLTPEGGELWLSSDRANGVDMHLLRSVRGTDGVYRTPERVPALESNADEFGAAFSADGLTVFFASTRAGGAGDLDVWASRRTAIGIAFSAPTSVGELNTASVEIPTWLSSDGCRLYMTSERQGNSDIYVATRPL